MWFRCQGDCPFNNLSIRDRSWGEQCHERCCLLPLYTWMNAAFAFIIGAHDDPARDELAISDEQLMPDAWIFDHGGTLKVTSVSKLAERAEDILRPLRHVIECTTTADGCAFRFVGEVLASTRWHCWQNALCHCGLTRWTSPQVAGVGWGVQWNDFVARMCAPL